MAPIEVKAGRAALGSGPHHLNCSRKQEIRAWAVMVALVLATLIAGYILWAKISGL